MEFRHISVLLEETIEMLQIKPDGAYLDGTVGGAGHSSRILEKLEDGVLIAMDKDDAALETSLSKLQDIGGNFVLAKGDYLNADLLVRELELEGLDGALLDLGVSSYQIDEGERGFSFQQDAPLDMRMDQSQSLSAKTIVNEYSEEEIQRILWEYGEERWAKRIAQIIVERRPIETTFELVDAIKRAVPQGARDHKHPAKRTFQALRIAVNDELSDLEESLTRIINVLKPGGRLAVITFHSLEDRIVKQLFKVLENPCTCPPELPQCVCGKVSLGKVITKKPIIPNLKEMEFNSRSHSAKLRVFERN
ncbi:16S rRNA (cytosine(1402)-N(4))-methyltransferase RsmH [Guggenheimella bovis]